MYVAIATRYFTMGTYVIKIMEKNIVHQMVHANQTMIVRSATLGEMWITGTIYVLQTTQMFVTDNQVKNFAHRTKHAIQMAIVTHAMAIQP